MDGLFSTGKRCRAFRFFVFNIRFVLIYFCFCCASIQSHAHAEWPPPV